MLNQTQDFHPLSFELPSKRFWRLLITSKMTHTYVASLLSGKDPTPQYSFRRANLTGRPTLPFSSLSTSTIMLAAFPESFRL